MRIGCFSAQVDVYKGQVRLFSKTIVQLEKTVTEEQERRVKMQAELDSLNKKVKGIRRFSHERDG